MYLLIPARLDDLQDHVHVVNDGSEKFERIKPMRSDILPSLGSIRRTNAFLSEIYSCLATAVADFWKTSR